MKLKLFALIFTLAFVLSLTGCGKDTTKNDSDNMASDIKSDMQSAGDKLESGAQSAEDKIESDMQSGESGMQSTDNSSNTNSDAKISKDQAKKIALDDAKLKESEIKNYRIKLDKDDGVLVYELEFDHNSYEYDYEIDANTGAIREHDKDHLD